jgi:cytoskeletal protein RodZ
MTRTDVAASSGPRKARATSLSRGSSRTWRRLSVVPIALLLAAVLLLPQSALAAESTSGYSQTVPTPKTTTTPTTGTSPSKTTTSPSTGTSPSKEEKTSSEKTTPSGETSPAGTTPTSTSKAKSSELPFTGFELQWALGGGLLLTGAGFSLLLADRRQRRRASR